MLCAPPALSPTQPQNNVEGTIPAGFFDALINITAVNLGYNSISGTIPTEVRSPSVHTLAHSRAPFEQRTQAYPLCCVCDHRATHRAHVGKLRNVRTLEMRNNRFVGTIPTEIANLGYALGYDEDEGTTSLDLAHSNLTGTIPSEIGFLEALKVLDLSNNPHLGLPVSDNPNLVLNPPMPTELGLLTRMEEINFDFSGFEGTIPTEIGQLSKLRHLFMRGKLKPFDPTSNRISGAAAAGAALVARFCVAETLYKVRAHSRGRASPFSTPRVHRHDSYGGW